MIYLGRDWLAENYGSLCIDAVYQIQIDCLCSSSWAIRSIRVTSGYLSSKLVVSIHLYWVRRVALPRRLRASADLY